MSTTVETKTEAQLEGGIAHIDNGSLSDEKKGGVDKAGAIEAENAEHEMGVLEAVKAYPMATLWAFIMSCTIVSCLPLGPLALRHLCRSPGQAKFILFMALRTRGWNGD
jgi:SP family general alpha glucoside:H+ symporter-like MFS transporter